MTGERPAAQRGRGGAAVVAGFGFRSDARAESLAEALDTALAQAADGIAPCTLATAADKACAAAFRALASARSLPVTALPETALRRQPTATRSAASLARRGTGSLAEAAALAAAGPGARLLAPRAVSADRMATCALAEGAPG